MFLNTVSPTESELLALFLSAEQRAAYPQMANPTQLTLPSLSAHFHDSPASLHPHSGVAELMRAVLEDAIYCFRLGAGKTVRARRLAQEAQAWFDSDNERWPFAFVNVCRALGLDPASVRRMLRQSNDQTTVTPLRKKRIEAARRRPLRCAA